MLFQRINRTDPEKIFMVVKAGEALLAGRPVALHFTGTDDGLLGFTANAAPDATSTVGIADAAVASGDYGLVQCYGYRTSAKVQGGSDADPLAHDILAVMSESSGGLSQSVSVGEITANLPMFICAVSASSASSAAYQDMPIFIRCM